MARARENQAPIHPPQQMVFLSFSSFTPTTQNFDTLCQWITAVVIHVTDFQPAKFKFGDDQALDIPGVIQEIITPPNGLMAPPLAGATTGHEQPGPMAYLNPDWDAQAAYQLPWHLPLQTTGLALAAPHHAAEQIWSSSASMGPATIAGMPLPPPVGQTAPIVAQQQHIQELQDQLLAKDQIIQRFQASHPYQSSSMGAATVPQGPSHQPVAQEGVATASHLPPNATSDQAIASHMLPNAFRGQANVYTQQPIPPMGPTLGPNRFSNAQDGAANVSHVLPDPARGASAMAYAAAPLASGLAWPNGTSPHPTPPAPVPLGQPGLCISPVVATGSNTPGAGPPGCPHWQPQLQPLPAAESSHSSLLHVLCQQTGGTGPRSIAYCCPSHGALRPRQPPAPDSRQATGPAAWPFSPCPTDPA